MKRVPTGKQHEGTTGLCKMFECVNKVWGEFWTIKQNHAGGLLSGFVDSCPDHQQNVTSVGLKGMPVSSD